MVWNKTLCAQNNNESRLNFGVVEKHHVSFHHVIGIIFWGGRGVGLGFWLGRHSAATRNVSASFLTRTFDVVVHNITLYATQRFKNLERFAVVQKGIRVEGVQGYLAHKKLPPPQDHRRALGMVIL